jgi:nucleoside-diphosphate-sugar epimerase
MRILLTGATGYLGGWIRAELAKRHDVICTVRPDTGLEGLGDTVEWDLSAELPTNMPKVDTIVHAAQSRHYTTFPGGAADAFAVNCASTAKLLDFAARTSVDRFCFLSSGSVYEPFNGSLDETAALAPTSLNGTTKLSAELLTRAYDGVMAVNRLRLFFPYGPGQTERMVPGLINRVRTGEAVTLAGQNGLEFSPLFAGDIATIVAAAVADSWQDTVNVAGRDVIHLRGFADTIGDVLGKPPVFEVKDVESPRIVAPTARLKSRFPVETMTSVRHGLEQTLGADRHTA